MSANKIRKFFAEAFVIIAMLLIGYGCHLIHPGLVFIWAGIGTLAVPIGLNSEYADQEDEA